MWSDYIRKHFVEYLLNISSFPPSFLWPRDIFHQGQGKADSRAFFWLFDWTQEAEVLVKRGVEAGELMSRWKAERRATVQLKVENQQRKIFPNPDIGSECSAHISLWMSSVSSADGGVWPFIPSCLDPPRSPPPRLISVDLNVRSLRKVRRESGMKWKQ